ncbi:unnamed protein product [Cylicocyclus nassatus]|uniref:SCP domain-containing protein n=1 Tax=Cylicocyclus nassatus TaxID=53992 RepID=A0AA36M3A4_CYLNA|nr:unnamed protein product [Cylicocyclus nassatus]
MSIKVQRRKKNLKMELLLMVVTHLLLLFSSKTYTNAEDTACTKLGSTASNPSNATERDSILKVFNDMREHIATKQSPEGDNLKKAKNMYKLFWNCSMEKKVRKSVEKKKGATLTKDYAQNYAIFKSGTSTTLANYTNAAKQDWYNQVIIHGLDKNQTYTDGLDFFANMVNAKATQVACAYDDDGTNVHYSCIFNVKPVKGQSIYERGTPCSKNSQCTTYPGSSCDTVTKLCKYEGDIPEPEVTSTDATTATNVNPTGGTTATGVTPTAATTTADIKLDNAYMTVAGRTKVVNAHNYRRTLLATGQIRNGKNPSNANLPTAAFMSKMEYDMNLEAQAIEHAKGCSLEKSDESTRTGIGENVYVHKTVIKDPVELFNIVAISWWTQIFQDGINNQLIFSENLRDKQAKKGIDQTAFTQIAWANTSKIGCASVDCSGKSFVVCRYSPAGNILNQPIYRIGYVCQGCQGTCSSADGLCIMT